MAGFHSRTVPSPPALASSLPSGLNATPYTPCRALACRGAPTARPVAGFHSRTVPSAPALASSLPPGLNATANTVDGSAGSMPCCCCSASRVVMAEAAWPVGKTAQAATASRRAVTRIGAVDVEAFGGELAGQGDGMLVAGAGGVARGGGGVVRRRSRRR